MRILVFEDLDREASQPQWLTPVLRRLGHSAWPLPAFEAVCLLGIEEFARFLLEVAVQIRPHVIFVRASGFYADPDTAARLRGLGARLVVWCDLPLQQLDDSAQLAELLDVADLVIANAEIPGVPPERYRCLPLLMSHEAIELDDPRAPSHRAVLIGRYTERLGAMARKVAESGAGLFCYGQGWALGEVTRASRLGLMRRANYVIVPPYDQITMIEAMLLGATLVVEEKQQPAPLAELPLLRFGDTDELISILQAPRPARWHIRPAAIRAQLEAILARLDVGTLPFRARSGALEQMYASLARVYEAHGRLAAACAAYGAWVDLSQDAWSPEAGLARCYLRAGRAQESRDHARRSQSLLPGDAGQPIAGATPLRLPAFLDGFHVGITDPLIPSLEPIALEIASLVVEGEVEAAIELLRQHDLSTQMRVREALDRIGPVGQAMRTAISRLN